MTKETARLICNNKDINTRNGHKEWSDGHELIDKGIGARLTYNNKELNTMD